MNLIYISFGSNVHDRISFIKQALNNLIKAAKAENILISPVYKTTPIDMDSENFFLNGIIKFHSELDPFKILEITKKIEMELGRPDSEKGKKLDRTIDLDIILFNNDRIDEPELKIPHPGLKKRLFVLIPLLEISPDLIDPETGQILKNIINFSEFSGQAIEKTTIKIF